MAAFNSLKITISQAVDLELEIGLLSHSQRHLAAASNFN